MNPFQEYVTPRVQGISQRQLGRLLALDQGVISRVLKSGASATPATCLAFAWYLKEHPSKLLKLGGYEDLASKMKELCPDLTEHESVQSRQLHALLETLMEAGLGDQAEAVLTALEASWKAARE